MSCGWYIYCETCDECLVDCDVNHGGDDLMAVCRGAIPLLVEVAARLPGAVVSLESLGVFSRAEGCESGVRLGKLVGHKGHVILPKNEYGEYYGECGESQSCSCCGGSSVCRKARGHEGDHVFRDRSCRSLEEIGSSGAGAGGDRR